MLFEASKRNFLSKTKPNVALEIRIFASSITEAALMDRDEYRLSLQPWMSRCALGTPHSGGEYCWRIETSQAGD